MADQPNIVLICVDQWRGDCLSAAGHPVVMTPYLDGWMATGTRFRRAYSATPTCVPARAALFTGLSQEHHGRVGYRDGVPWEYPTTMAGELGRAGYQTQAVGKMHVYPERRKMGFDNVALHDGYLHFARSRNADLAEIDDYVPWLREKMGYDADYIDHGLNCNSIVARPWDKPEYVHPTTWVVTRSIEFLRDRDAERPFFLYASFHRPHPPYDPPAWAFDQYIDQEMPDPPVGDWVDLWQEYEDSVSPESQVARYEPRLLQRARAGYYGHMSHIDQQVERLLEELRGHGDTVICFVADHGEMMGDHHLYRKSLPYEGSANVPFAIAGPGIPAGVNDSVVELRDVFPTLLDVAGGSVSGLDGQSVLPLARGESVDWRTDLHGEHLAFGQSIQWLTDGREKYVWCSGTGAEQFFDLTVDPTELLDLARDPSNSDRVAQWRSRLVEALAGRPEGFVDGGQLVSDRPVDAVLP
jgi:arylsulfatase A-like enzyme